jgi:DNA-binding NarL/FixJ family response regulator
MPTVSPKKLARSNPELASKTHRPPAPAGPTRILLVDDHPLVREGLAEVLGRESDLVICGEAESRQQALELIPTAKPDLAIIDLALKKSHGLELIKDIRALFPKVLMLVVSMQDEGLNAERAIQAGARGYITKDEATVNVVQAVRTVLRGEVFASPQLITRMLLHSGQLRPAHGPDLNTLSDRELQVFELIGQGLSRNEIAARLNMAISTLETHRARIRDKLGISDAQELLQTAIRYNRERGACG